MSEFFSHSCFWESSSHKEDICAWFICLLCRVLRRTTAFEPFTPSFRTLVDHISMNTQVCTSTPDSYFPLLRSSAPLLRRLFQPAPTLPAWRRRLFPPVIVISTKIYASCWETCHLRSTCWCSILCVPEQHFVLVCRSCTRLQSTAAARLLSSIRRRLSHQLWLAGSGLFKARLYKTCASRPRVRSSSARSCLRSDRLPFRISQCLPSLC